MLTSVLEARLGIRSFVLHSFALVALLKRGMRANCSHHSLQKKGQEQIAPVTFFLRRLEQNEQIAPFTFSNTRALYKSGLCSFLKRKRRAGLRHLNYTFWLCLKKAEKKSKSLSSLFSKRAKVQFALLKRAKEQFALLKRAK